MGVDREKLYLAEETLATRGLRCDVATKHNDFCLRNDDLCIQNDNFWMKRASLGGPRLLAGEILSVSIQTRTAEGWSLRTGGAIVTMQFQPEGSVLAWRAIDREDGAFDASFIATQVSLHS